MPEVDTSGGLPDGKPGSGRLELVNARRTDRSNPPDIASFRTDCEFSHMNFDDVIVSPGQPGAAHLHAYFGNTDVDAFSTNDSIINSGNSTCAGGIANRSSYWAPAMVDTRTGRPIKPDGATVYYKTGWRGAVPSRTVAPPNGLRIIAGDHSETGPDANIRSSRTIFFCTPKGQLGGPFKMQQSVPDYCKPGDLLRMRVTFPNCWDGKNLDSADHKSHMAYTKGTPNNRVRCPASHPVQIPGMALNVDYIVPGGGNNAVKHWRLVSDNYDASIPAGYSAHADWIVGWDQDIFNRMLEGCYRPAKDCGHNNLNDGQALRIIK